MPGRHSASAQESSRTWATPVTVVALLVVAAVVGGGFVLAGGRLLGTATASACSDGTPVRIAATPDLAPALEAAGEAIEAQGSEGGRCLDYRVTAVASASVADDLAGTAARPPDLWVPDSSMWTERVTGTGARPHVLTDSLASTPVLVAGERGAGALSWLQLLGAGTPSMTDPASTSTGASALLSMVAESGATGAAADTMGSVLVPMAQAYGAWQDRPSTAAEAVSHASGDQPAVVTEQQMLHSRSDVPVRAPGTGSIFLDYPLLALAEDATTREAGQRLAAYLSGRDGRGVLASASFRGPDGAPLADRGVGAVRRLALPSTTRSAETLQRWAALTRPARSLAVLDVSGSMRMAAGGGRTRISLAVDAARTALRLFPDTAQIGMWAFSQQLGRGDRDYRPLEPVAPLGAASGAGTHRDALMTSLASLPRLTTGGTGLYDTTLAAVREVRRGYDKDAVNTVILLTDGTNDDPGSIALDDLLGTLKDEADRKRPVQVVAIGMGPDTDASALRQIAEATGGRSFVAREPGAIMQVFRDALLGR